MNRAPADEVSALLSPEGARDPYPIYRRLRERGQVVWTDAFEGAWLVLSHELVSRCMSDARLSMERGVAPVIRFDPSLSEEYKAFARFYGNIMLLRDGKRHRRLRAMVSKAFTPRAVDGLEGLVQRCVDHLLEPYRGAGRMELVSTLAYPLPAIVISEMMGLPWSDRERLRVWADDLSLFLGGTLDTEEMAAAAQRSALAMARYFEEHITARRERPGDDLISALLAVREGGDQLRPNEVWAQCLLLFSAGHQTTRDLISGGMWVLMDHPDELAKLRQDPDVIPAAIEEMLRWDCPVQLAGRMATKSFELDGQPIEAGQKVILALGAANRDPARFPEPDAFRVDRQRGASPAGNLAFGGGAHTCLGAFLARLEARLAFTTVLRDMPDIRPLAEPERLPNATFRRISALPVAWTT